MKQQLLLNVILFTQYQHLLLLSPRHARHDWYRRSNSNPCHAKQSSGVPTAAEAHKSIIHRHWNYRHDSARAHTRRVMHNNSFQCLQGSSSTNKIINYTKIKKRRPTNLYVSPHGTVIQQLCFEIKQINQQMVVRNKHCQNTSVYSTKNRLITDNIQPLQHNSRFIQKGKLR